MEESKVTDVKQAEKPKVEKKKGVGADVNIRLKKLEDIVAKLVKRVNLDDQPVTLPEKSNYNPDFLPTGGKPVTLDEIEKIRKGT